MARKGLEVAAAEGSEAATTEGPAHQEEGARVCTVRVRNSNSHVHVTVMLRTNCRTQGGHGRARGRSDVGTVKEARGKRARGKRFVSKRTYDAK